MIIFILIVAFVLRLINLNQSLWLDEAVQAITAQKSLSFIAEEIKGDFHPPLYHLLMHFWVRVFGSSEISLRFPSVLFGIGTVWAVYLIAREVSDQGSVIGDQGSGVGRDERGIHWSLFTGRRSPVADHRSLLPLTVALLMATAPFHVYYSQEARMYSLAALLTSFSIYLFIRTLKLINFQDKEDGQGRDYFKTLTLYIFVTSLAIYSDYYAILVLVLQIGVGVILKQKKLISAWLAILLLYPLILPVFWSQIMTGVAATKILPAWGKLVNLSFFKALPLTFIKFSLGRITIFNRRLYALVSGVVLIFYGGLLINLVKKLFPDFKNIKRNLTENPYLFLITIWLIFPLVVSWFASLLVPNYQPFRLLLILPAFYLLLNFGIFSLPASIRNFAFILVLVINFGALMIYYRNPYFYREDWRGLSAYIKNQRIPLVISAKAFDWPLVYYQAGSQVISVVEDLRPVNGDKQSGFYNKIMNEKRLSYTPYLADVYDPSLVVPTWLEKVGFVRINEVSFNQIPLWVYQR